VKPSLIGEVVVEVLQEGLVGATMIGLRMIHQLYHKLSLHHMLQHALSHFIHHVERN
jgi:hypothetical protein